MLTTSESEVLIHFDGWGDGYDYWCTPDAVELHPPGWCSKHNWELQTPKGQLHDITTVYNVWQTTNISVIMADIVQWLTANLIIA